MFDSMYRYSLNILTTHVECRFSRDMSVSVSDRLTRNDRTSAGKSDTSVSEFFSASGRTAANEIPDNSIPFSKGITRTACKVFLQVCAFPRWETARSRAVRKIRDAHSAERVNADVQFRGRVRDKIIMRIIPAHRTCALLRDWPRASRNSRRGRNDETSLLEYSASRRNASPRSRPLRTRDF